MPFSAENFTIISAAIVSIAAAWWGRQHKKTELEQTGEKLGVEVQSSAQQMLITAAELLRKDVTRIVGENDELRARVVQLEKSDSEKERRLHDVGEELEQLREDNEKLIKGIDLLIAQLEAAQMHPVWKPPTRKPK